MIVMLDIYIDLLIVWFRPCNWPFICLDFPMECGYSEFNHDYYLKKLKEKLHVWFGSPYRHFKGSNTFWFTLWSVLLDSIVDGCQSQMQRSSMVETIPDAPASLKDPIKMKPHCPFFILYIIREKHLSF